jgi:hypothetical protein
MNPTKHINQDNGNPAEGDQASTEKRLIPIMLPEPELKGGKSLIEALKKRRTTREISSRDLPVQILSNLLWAACGVNRRNGPFGIPGRTAASASNSQEIDIYVMTSEGIYLYNHETHSLLPVIAGDFRKLAIGKGQSGYGNQAPVRLVFVADLDRLVHTKGYMEPGLLDSEVQKSYYYADTGIIAANVYLFAASSGLAAWFHNCNRDEIKSLLKLPSDKVVLFGQTVGYPDK